METIIKLELPLKRVKPLPKGALKYHSRRVRWTAWLFTWFGGSWGNLAGQINTRRNLCILGWHVLTVDRNEFHDRSDKERADEYLCEWSKCEEELRRLRLLQMGDSFTHPELRKLLKNSLGVDLDEGRIQ